MKNLPSLALCFICLVASLISCDSRRPAVVYDSKKMEAILYDYHLAQALAAQHKDSAAFYNNLYTSAVLSKHGTTRETFDSSLLWYMRNTEKLYNIYDRLDLRMEKEAQKGRVEVGRMGGDANTDTLELWSLKNSFLLTNHLGQNRANFTLLTDSVFSEGDQVIWNFDLQWFYQKGDKRATAMLILTYEGDSIATYQRSFYRDGHESISMRVASKPVKSVRGFVYQEATWTERKRFLSITNLSLLRIHKKD